MQKKLVIFDFDGVLVRTADIGYTLHLRANPTLTRDYFAKFSDGNFIENIERAIREDNYQVQENWDELYHDELLKLTSHEVIDGLIRDLSVRYVLAIVSSSMSYHIADFVKKEGLEGCFTEILGSDVHASKVVKINALLERHGFAPEDAIFVTDTLGDIREGNTCGVASVGVTWGTHDRDTLALGKPYDIVDSVIELEHSINRFFVQE